MRSDTVLLAAMAAFVAAAFGVLALDFAFNSIVFVFCIAVAIALLCIVAFSGEKDRSLLCELLLDPADGSEDRRLCTPRELYRRALDRGLLWFDRRLNPDRLDLPETRWRRAWGWRLYDRCLLLALLYPLLFVLIAWIASPDEAGRLGTLPVFPAETSQEGRFGVGALYAALFVYFLMLKPVSNRLQGVFEKLGAGSGTAEILAFAFALAFAAAGAGAFTGAVTVAGAGAFAMLVVFTLLFAGREALTTIDVLSDLPPKQPEAAYAFLVSAVLLALAAALALSTPSEDGVSVILFLGLLPLVNAQFDFLSTVFTRRLLRQGWASPTTSGQVFWGIADFGVGCALFALLTLTAVVVGEIANRLAGASVVDFAAIFADPEGHRWLFWAFLTTLLPTALHALLFILSLAFASPPGLRRWCAARIQHGSEGPAIMARLAVALWAGLTVAATCLILRLAWQEFDHLTGLGASLLAICKGFWQFLAAL